MKYKDWLIDWLDNYIKQMVKKRTYERYKNIVVKRLKENLGNLELNEITPLIIQKYINELLSNGNAINGKGLSSNSVNLIITVIKNSLKMAYNIGLLEKNISDLIIRPKTNERKITCFNIKEQKMLENYILMKKQENLYGIILCLYTGLRIGELLALEWSDLDLNRQVINVNKTCYDSKDETGRYFKNIDTPKTKSSIRMIPIPKQLVSLIKEWKKNSKGMYIVSNQRGETMRIRSYQRTFELLLKKINIAHQGFHSLRHTFATRAIECGMDVKTLSEILGHKNPNITLNRYTHSLSEHKKEMMNKLGKLF